MSHWMVFRCPPQDSGCGRYLLVKDGIPQGWSYDDPDIPDEDSRDRIKFRHCKECQETMISPRKEVI